MNKRTNEGLNGRIKKREERNEWMKWIMLSYIIYLKMINQLKISYIGEEFARLNKC